MKNTIMAVFAILPLMNAMAVTCSENLNEGDCRTCTCPGYGRAISRSVNPSTGKCMAKCSQQCEYSKCHCSNLKYNGFWYYCDCSDKAGHGDYCETCLPGYYAVRQNTEDKNQEIYNCYPCPNGTYMEGIGTNYGCNTCPNGGTTLATGATDIQSCLYPADKNYLDDTGTYVYIKDCYYTK